MILPKRKLIRSYKKKTLSEEHKKKIGESSRRWHKEIGFSKETRKKLSLKAKGHILSEEGKKKISEANKGKAKFLT